MASIRKLNDGHIRLIEPILPKERGMKRVGLKKTLNGILHVIRTGMPSRYGRHKTAYNMFRRCSRSGAWAKILAILASQDPETQAAMADSSAVKAHRTSMSMAAGSGTERAIGRSRGGPTTKLHMLSDPKGRPIGFHLTGGNVSDYKGFKELIKTMPHVEFLVADGGYDANWIRSDLEAMGIQPCIPGRRIERRRSTSTKTCTKRGTGSKTLSPNSRTAGTSHCASTDVQGSFLEWSSLRPSSNFGCEGI